MLSGIFTNKYAEMDRNVKRSKKQLVVLALKQFNRKVQQINKVSKRIIPAGKNDFDMQVF